MRILLRPAMIFLPFLFGFFCPQAHALNEAPFHLIQWVLFIMLFLSCLQLELTQLKFRKEHFKVAVANLAMGIIPYFLLKFVFPQQPGLAESAFFAGITPTATATPVVLSFLNGRVGFALTGFATTTLVVSVSLIFLLPLIAGDFSLVFILRVLNSLFLVIGLPFFCALILRKWFPSLKKLPSKCKLFSLSLWSCMLFVMAAIARNHLQMNPDVSRLQIFLIGLISLMICILNFWIGKRISRKKYAKESSQILGQKNTNLTLFLALQYAGPLVALGPIFYVMWHNSWNAFQIYSYDKRKQRSREIRKKSVLSVQEK